MEDLLKNENSKEFSTLKAQNEKMLKSVYAQQLFVLSTIVINFRKGSVIVDYQLVITADVDDPSLPLKQALNSSGETLHGLKIDPSSIQTGPYVTPSSSQAPRTECSQDCNTVPITVLGVLLGVSVVLNVIFIVYFVWKYTQLQEQKRGYNKRKDITDESGYMNTIALQDINQSSSNQLDYEIVDNQIQPEQSSGKQLDYEIVDNQIQPEQSSSNQLDYEIVDNQIQPEQSSSNQLDYEIVDNQSQPEQSPGNPSLYQSVEPHSSTYSSLSPATKLPPKPSLPSDQSQANPNNSVYQDLQGVSHQYQSLSSLSPC